MNAIWVEDNAHEDYIGPTSQVEVAVNQEEPIAHGRDGSCRRCADTSKYDPLAFLALVLVRYSVNGVRHDHAYKAEFDK